MPDQELPSLGERARELLAASGNCAQTSFAVLAEYLGIDAAQTLKALTPFPGIALRGETCGAVVGCVMAIGLALGRERLDDYPGMRPSLAVARRFCRGFETRFSGTTCRHVLKQGLGGEFDLASGDGAAAYLEAGGHEYCAKVVADSVQLAVEMLARSGRA